MIPIFSHSYYQTIHTFQISYVPILRFSESYITQLHKLFQSSYRTVLTFSESYNQVTLTFSEFMSNKQFQIELLPILRTIIKEIVPNNLAKLSLFLLTGRIVPSPFFQSLLVIMGHPLSTQIFLKN